MKNFSSVVAVHFKRQLAFLLYLGSITSCFFHIPFSSYISLSNVTHCSAMTILQDSNDTVSKTTSLFIDTCYQNVLTSYSSHYYCLYGQKKSDHILIFIETKEISSFSFQLFDSSGVILSPSDYQYTPSKKILQISYYFSTRENYLFLLNNLSSDSISYTIKYEKETTQKTKGTTSKQNNNVSKSKNTTSKQNSNVSKSKSTTSKQNSNVSKSKNTTLKPNNNISNSKNTTSKPYNNNSNSKNTTSKPGKNSSKSKHSTISKKRSSLFPKKIILSKTFLQTSPGEILQLNAIISPKNASTACQWTIADTSILSAVQKKKNRSSTCISIKTIRKGTTIVTCKTTGRKKLSASCTIKVS